MFAAQVLGGIAQAVDGTGGQVLDKDIGLFQRPFEHLAVGILAQVEADGFLAPVQPDEIGAFAVHKVVIGAGKVALGAFDLEHAGPGLGQAAGQVGGGDGLFDGDDKKAIQILCHEVSFSCGFNLRSGRGQWAVP